MNVVDRDQETREALTRLDAQVYERGKVIGGVLALREQRDALAARAAELQQALRERDKWIAVQVAYQRGERAVGVAEWEWPQPSAGSPAGRPDDACICKRFSDLPDGTIIADLCCPVHGVDGTDPGDVLPPAGRPDE